MDARDSGRWASAIRLPLESEDDEYIDIDNLSTEWDEAGNFISGAARKARPRGRLAQVVKTKNTKNRRRRPRTWARRARARRMGNVQGNG